MEGREIINNIMKRKEAKIITLISKHECRVDKGAKINNSM